MKGYEGSKQWNKDKGRFRNPPEWPSPPSFRDVMRWQFGRPRPEKGFVPKAVANDGLLLRENTRELSITWIGHATLLLQLDGMSVITDPIFAARLFTIKRLAPPGVALADLPRIDVVLISHNHLDHLDEPSVRALGPEVQYVTPLGLGAWFRERGLTQVTELDWWQDVELSARGGRVRITLVPAQHWSRRGMLDANLSLWGGFVIESATARCYFSGDTGYPAAFAEIGRRFPGIDYALLPIGAYAPRWFMRAQHIDPNEAVTAFGELQARKLVPMHWGTFRLSDEPLAEPPQLLREALGKAGLLPALSELAIGETLWGKKQG